MVSNQVPSAFNLKSKNFQWFLLGYLFLIYFIYWLCFKQSFISNDLFNDTLYEMYVPDSNYPQPEFLAFLLKILFYTGHGFLLFEFLIQILFVFALWWGLKELIAINIKPLYFWLIFAYWTVFPMIPFIFYYTSKDQYISVLIFLLGILIFKILKQKNLSTSLMIEVILVLILLALFRPLYLSLMIGVFLILIIKNQEWKKFIIIGVVATGSFLIINFAVDAVMPNQTVNSSEALSVPIQEIGAIFSNDNSNIPDDLNQYFTETFGSKTFYQSYDPIISDPEKILIRNEEFSTGEFVFNSQKLCLLNFGTCVGAWFNLESGFFLPKPLQSLIVNSQYQDSSNAPQEEIWNYFEIRTSTNKYRQSENYYEAFLYSMISSYGIESDICENFQSNSLSCLEDPDNTPLGEDGSIAAQNLDDYYNKSIFDHTLFGESTINYFVFFNALSILQDGWWLFYLSFILFGISLFKKSYRIFLPLSSLPVLIYLELLISAPISYERYLFPLYLLVPFILFLFLQKKIQK